MIKYACDQCEETIDDENEFVGIDFIKGNKYVLDNNEQDDCFISDGKDDIELNIWIRASDPSIYDYLFCTEACLTNYISDLTNKATVQVTFYKC